MARYEGSEASSSSSSNYEENPSSRLFNNSAQSFTLLVDIREIREKINDAESVKNFAACLSLCSQAIKIHPEVISFAALKAKYLVLTYQSDEANAILARILKHDSQNAEAISTLGFVFYHQANFKKSVEVFGNALQIDKSLHDTVILRNKAERFLQILEQSKNYFHVKL